MPTITADEQASNLRTATVRAAVMRALGPVLHEHPDLTYEEVLDGLLTVAGRMAQHLRSGATTPLVEPSHVVAILNWCAAEVDYQVEAHREAVPDIDATDHIRCFADQPDRRSAVPWPDGVPRPGRIIGGDQT